VELKKGDKVYLRSPEGSLYKNPYTFDHSYNQFALIKSQAVLGSCYDFHVLLKNLVPVEVTETKLGSLMYEN
jgi:hypothetical protein